MLSPTPALKFMSQLLSLRINLPPRLKSLIDDVKHLYRLKQVRYPLVHMLSFLQTGSHRIPEESRDFSRLQTVQTGSGIYSASCSMGTGVSFPGVKRPGRELHHSSPYKPKLRMSGAVPLLPFYTSMAWKKEALSSPFPTSQLRRMKTVGHSLWD
jgi:hypothetical protein